MGSETLWSLLTGESKTHLKEPATNGGPSGTNNRMFGGDWNQITQKVIHSTQGLGGSHYLSPGGNSRTLCLPTNISPQNLVAWSNNNHLIISHGICGPGSQGWAQLSGSGSGSHEVVVSGKLALELHGTVVAGELTKHLSLFSCSLRASPCDCFMCDSLGFLTAWWESHRANTNITGLLYYAFHFRECLTLSLLKIYIYITN